MRAHHHGRSRSIPESRLAAIAIGVDAPTADWVRKLISRLDDPRAGRNAALREAARLVEADLYRAQPKTWEIICVDTSQACG